MQEGPCYVLGNVKGSWGNSMGYVTQESRFNYWQCKEFSLLPKAS